MFGAERANSEGLDMSDKPTLDQLRKAISSSASVNYVAAPILGGEPLAGEGRPVCSPADRRLVVGRVVEATNEHVNQAMTRAQAAFFDWGGHASHRTRRNS